MFQFSSPGRPFPRSHLSMGAGGRQPYAPGSLWVGVGLTARALDACLSHLPELLPLRALAEALAEGPGCAGAERVPWHLGFTWKPGVLPQTGWPGKEAHGPSPSQMADHVASQCVPMGRPGLLPREVLTPSPLSGEETQVGTGSDSLRFPPSRERADGQAKITGDWTKDQGAEQVRVG